MNIYLKQKIFTLKDKFTAYDEDGNTLYTGVGKYVSLRDYHYLYNLAGEEVACIHRKVLALVPKMYIEKPDATTHEMKGKLAFAHDVFEIKDLDWKITGKFLSHDYTITEGGKEIVTMHQKWLAWGNCFEISIADGVDEVLALAVILSIDVIHEEEDNADTTINDASNLINSNN